MPEQLRQTKSERRTRILLALDDGERRLRAIAAWSELSDQAVRADMEWLEHKGFAAPASYAAGRPLLWRITVKGYDYLATLPAQERTW